ncbi:MAG: sulfite exporter TauE/SafE family protein, partial [Desulfovibrio sp.]|nr:sulfite exporter TauE/SafE family protein [Desulfovibrio sp.]
PSGVYRYLREGRMVWPLTWAVIIGTLPGVLLGAWVRVAWLPDPRRFKLFAAAVLGYIGCRMVRDLLFKKNGGHDRARVEKRPQVPAREPGGAASPGTSGGRALPPARVIRFDAVRIAYEFQGETYAVSTPGIFALSLLVGIVGGVYGIGGGSIIAPFFVSIYGLPVYTVAGAALMGTFVTSVAGVAFYQAIAPFYPHMSVAPDWGLGLLFGLGGMVGMYLGARCQRRVPARIIKGMLTAIIFFTVWKYVAEYLR